MKKVLGSVIIIIGLLLLPLLWPAPKDILHNTQFSPTVRSDNGELLRVFLTEDDKYRMWMDISQFNPEFIQALLLKEDQLFYSHKGIDLPALFRAFKLTYIDKERRVGASTITMQLVRLKDKLHTKSIRGKIIQIYKALYLDLHYSKQEILEAFLNLAPCGGNIEGFPAASEYYFSKLPKDLTLSETLFLVVLPQNPEVRSPKGGFVPDITKKSRKDLFKKWVVKHPEDIKWASTIDMPIHIVEKFPFIAPHLTEYIVDKYSRDKGLYSSTINMKYQKLVKKSLNSYIKHNRSIGVKNGSVMVLDHRTNNVVALIGSNDYYSDEIQGQVKGFSAKRSPGSTLKPFIYALALEQGVIHPHTMQKDSPQTFGVYTPDNYESNFKGPIFAWDALVQSKNIPALNLADSIKNPDLFDFLKSGGVKDLKDREHYGLSIVLGGAELTMIELTALYSVLSNNGIYRDITFLKDENNSKSYRLLTEASSYLTIDSLRKNPPAIKYRPIETKDIPVAFKTGTSIGFKDSWAIGVVDNYIIAVWIGNFDGSGNPAFIGRKMAAPLLFSIADTLLIENNSEPAEDMIPENVTMVPVCSVSGGIPNEHCPETIETGFIPGVSPISKCNIHRLIYIDMETGLRTSNRDSKVSRKEVREIWSSDLMDLFEQAGLPRVKPPPFKEELDNSALAEIGYPPKIVSPLDSGEYIIRKDHHKHNKIILDAYIDGDSTNLYWFANNNFLGSGDSKSRLEWTPDVGTYDITAVDSLGRSSTVSITVSY